MLRWLLVSLLLAASGCASLGPVAPSVVGKWTWAVAPDSCVEVYDFHSDGWMVTDSGPEHTEGSYIAGAPDERGYIVLHRHIMRDYGGIDCAGSNYDDTGRDYTDYAHILPDGKTLFFCAEANEKSCIGPLHRRPDVEPYEIAAQSGAPIEIEFWYSVNPDCTSRGATSLRIVTPPRHGKIELIDGWGYSTFSTENMREACNRRGVTGTHGYYRPEAGFTGRDSIVTEVLYPDGMVAREAWNIAVWPMPAERVVSTEPVYPESFRGRGIEGKVRAWLTLDSAGNVTHVAIQESRLDEFSRAFTEAAMQWKFKPPAAERTKALYIEQVEYEFKPQ